MHFMLNVFTNERSEGGGRSNPELESRVKKLIEELSEAGVLLAMAGLAPTAKGARMRLSSGKVTVTDGPFTEAKEVIGGAWIVETNTKEEAVEIATRVWQIFRDVNGPTYVGEGEVRELFGWVNLEASRRERTESPRRP
jgi:hypothetical protein